MKKILVILLYWGYNVLSGFSIHRYYKKVKLVNDKKVDPKKKEIKKYLLNWGFKSEISQNPLMNKLDVIEWTKKIDDKQVYQWAYTGGSFGEPLRVPYSKKRAAIRTATFKYFNEIAGYNLGDSFALIRAKNKSPFLKFLRNETIIIPFDVSNNQVLKIFDNLLTKNVTVLMGYPTVMYEMALFLKDNPKIKNKLKIKSLISVSEMLEEQKRFVVKNEFHCNFVDRYSNEEVGLIAQQKEFGGVYYVNKFGVYVEIVNSITLQPVKEGEVGKVVVTDIYNDLVPMIRYDTGDLAIVDRYKNGQLYTIKKILGREADKLFDTNKKPVSSLYLGPSIYKPFAIKGYTNQFQFAQTSSNSYVLRIKKGLSNPDEITISKVISNLRDHLGDNSNIKVVFLENIPALPSGKRPIYINELKKSSNV